jgi:hypothetical protein
MPISPGGRAGVLFAVLLVALTGCNALRLHDPGRMQTAADASRLAAELSRASGGPFDPMEQNLDEVRATQSRLRRLSEMHERETFVRVLPRLSADEVARKLVKSMQARQAVFAAIETDTAVAAKAVNDALDRQRLIVDQLRDTPNAKEVSDLTKTLERVRKRLEWIDGLREGLARLHERAGPDAKASAGGSVGDAVTKAGKSVASSDEALKDLVGSAKKTLEGVEKDDRVGAAMQLLRRAAEQTAAAEQMRLVEFRRYLADLQRLRERLAVRDVIVVCNLLTPAVFQVYPGATPTDPAAPAPPPAAPGTTPAKTPKQELKDAMDKLRGSGRYKDNCEQAMAKAVDDAVPDDVRARWSGKNLAGFSAAGLAETRPDDSPERRAVRNAVAPRLVAALGVVLFHEGPFLSDAELDVKRTLHRHSIRLSAINAQQRADLVHQLSQGLEIYHQGGIKPETVAQLLLMAGQVGALGFIGAQQ